jgi:hypothetical protein
MCVQMENTSKAMKLVNHGFHIRKTYSHIPVIFRILLARLCDSTDYVNEDNITIQPKTRQI